MKTTLTIAAIAISAFALSAGPLSPERALQRAMGTKALKTITDRQQSPRLVYTVTDSIDNPAVYVFNSRQGFMVVSADDVAVPLLGYAEKGTFAPDSMPPAMKWWLDTYSNQIASASANHAIRQYEDATPDTDNSLYPDIAPLTTTEWNQGNPYNLMCPTKNGSRCVTGCVATAMAQVMKYHNWPPCGTGQKSYNWNNTTLSFDYDNTPFQWDMMLDSYGQGSTLEEQDAVATLMYAAGVSVNMQYSPSASGAISSNVAKALTTYFDYDAGVAYQERAWFTEDEWHDLLYNQLRDYGPVVYGGQSDEGGHEFVCDGYHDGYFHINWGWGGMSNGYFLLDALDPESQGIGGTTSGYNSGQDIIANIRPSKAGSTMSVVLAGNTGLTVSPTVTTLGQPITLTTGYFNYSTGSVSNVTFGAAIIPINPTDTIYVESPSATVSNLSPNYGTMKYSYNVTLPADLPDGSYTLRPAYCDSNGDWHILRIVTSTNYCYEMMVEDGQVTFTPGIISALGIDDYTIDTPIYTDTPYKVTVTVTNPNDVEYHGYVIAVLLNSSGSIVDEGPDFTLDLEGGETATIEYIGTFGQATAGEYTFTFLSPGSSWTRSLVEIAPESIVDVGQAPTTSKVKVTNVTFNGVNMEGGVAMDVDPADVNVTINSECTDGIFFEPLNVYALALNGSTYTSVAMAPTNNLWLSDGQTATSDVHIDMSDVANPGTQYLLMVHDGKSWVSGQYYFQVAPEVTGIDTVAVDNSSTAAFDLNGFPVNIESAPAGIYITRTIDATGNVHTAKVLKH